MKRISLALITSMLACVLLISSAISVFASPDTAKINGVDAPVGSSVEYKLDLVAKKQVVVGIQMVFKFDTKVLKLKDVILDRFPSATVNANQNNDGMIYFNCSDINGVDFKELGEVARLNFEVIGKGDTTIEYFVQYLYDIDLVNLYDYKFTYSLTVDNNKVIENKVPELADVNAIISDVGANFDSGDFVNNQEGTGSGEKPVVTAAASNEKNDNKDKNNENSAIFVVAGIVVAALVAVIIVAVVKRNKTEE